MATGERVVRAILAHYAEPTFRAMCRDLDVDEYLTGYRSAPGSRPPIDQRSGASGDEHPRRRFDDYYT